MRWTFVALLAFSLSTTSATACDDGNSSATAEAAVVAWENNSGVILTDAARAHLKVKICTAILSIAAESGAAPSDIDAAASEPIQTYLNATANESGSVPQLRWLLGQDFLLHSGPRLPEPSMLVLVKIRYQHQADALLVGGKQMGAVDRLLADPGPLSLVGMNGNKTVCTGTLSVIVPGPQRFQC